MSADENKALVRQWIDEVWNQHQLDRIEDFYAPAYTMKGQPQSYAVIRQNISEILSSSPDVQVTVDAIIAEGDTVAYRQTFTATHQGPMQASPWGPIPATGKAIRMTGLGYVRVEGGKIAEDWGEVDLFSFFQQIGAIPTPELAQDERSEERTV